MTTIPSYEDWLTSKQTTRGAYRHYTEAQYNAWVADEEARQAQAAADEAAAAALAHEEQVRNDRNPLLELTDLDIRVDGIAARTDALPRIVDSLAAELRAAQESAQARQSQENAYVLGQARKALLQSTVVESYLEREGGLQGRITGKVDVLGDGTLRRTVVIRDATGRPTAAKVES